jgi:alanine-glyoxylate transaminase / serine-glyoxylate transaminase / serine-pyruvate transaminase
MLPPGLSFNALSEKALAAARSARLPRSYWDWAPMLAANAKSVFPYTPATNLLYGLREALAMLHEEGLAQVFARHDRHAEATRRAVRAWGLELVCQDPREYSSSLTAVLMPDGEDADALRRVILEGFDLSLGNGLGRLAGRVFRIGHLGDFNDLMLAGALAGIEMGLQRFGHRANASGVVAALDHLAAEDAARAPGRASAA